MFGFWRLFRQRLLDERFLVHRHKATSFAGSAVALAIGGLALYDHVVLGRFRWDLVGLLCLMVTVKLGCLVWYTLRD